MKKMCVDCKYVGNGNYSEPCMSCDDMDKFECACETITIPKAEYNHLKRLEDIFKIANRGLVDVVKE